MTNHYPEHLLFRCIVLRIVIWHIFWEILKTHHTLWKNTTFNSSLGVAKGMAPEKKYPCHMLRASKNLISIFMRTIIFLYCSTILIFSMFVSHVYNQISVLLCHLCIFYFCKIVCNVHAYIHILIRQLWENYGNWASGEIWAFFCKNIQ